MDRIKQNIGKDFTILGSREQLIKAAKVLEADGVIKKNGVAGLFWDIDDCVRVYKSSNAYGFYQYELIIKTHIVIDLNKPE